MYCIFNFPQTDKMAHGPDTTELLRRTRECLKELDVSYLNIHSLPELPSGLQKLYCCHTQLTSLPKLPDSLTELICDHTRLTSLPELPKKLRLLICSHNQITSLPNLPYSLRRLSCDHMPITELPRLPTRLISLGIQKTRITELPQLPVGLKELYCAYTPSLVLQRKENESIAEYVKRWDERREEIASKKRVQEKNKLLKEEIVMEAWKPERMERWIEVGYDPDE